MGLWLLVLGLRLGVMVGRVLCFCDVDVDADAVSFHAPGQNAIISKKLFCLTQRNVAGHCELFDGFLQISFLNQIYCKFH